MKIEEEGNQLIIITMEKDNQRNNQYLFPIVILLLFPLAYETHKLVEPCKTS